MLSIEKLKAGYEELLVLKGVSLEVNPGEIVALIGPNGAGKSTVIKSVFSIARKLGGKIVFEDKDITNLKTHELIKEGISYVNQGRINFGNLTVKENLEIGADYLDDKKEAKRRLESVFERFPILRERKDKLSYGLSGGQQQMLALGRALMQKPKLLMMDEPSLGLSPKLQKELFKMIKNLGEEGISLLVVEQNAKKAIEIADRTYLLENGEIALSGGKNILKNPKIKKVYLGGS
jgi:branched-chain amino acid transport system ATP-binding protein